MKSKPQRLPTHDPNEDFDDSSRFLESPNKPAPALVPPQKEKALNKSIVEIELSEIVESPTPQTSPEESIECSLGGSFNPIAPQLAINIGDDDMLGLSVGGASSMSSDLYSPSASEHLCSVC